MRVNQLAIGHCRDPQKIMKNTLRNVKMIIVDEVSMVSSLNLTYMHLRLEEMFGGNDWFGSSPTATR